MALSCISDADIGEKQLKLGTAVKCVVICKQRVFAVNFMVSSTLACLRLVLEGYTAGQAQAHISYTLDLTYTM